MSDSVLTDMTADEFCEAMDRDGFVVFRDVVPRDQLARLHDELCAEYERITASEDMFEGGGLLSGHLNCFPGERARFVYDELRARGIVDLIRSYRPELADSPRATLNFNLPGSVAQHYHMDDAFLKEFLICNIAVVDTEIENGAIDVLPGTNREYTPYWRFVTERKARLSTQLSMRAGDAVVRSSILWHRGMPNRTDEPRPMMAVTFGEAEPNADPFAQNDGEMEFYPNWFRTSRLGRVRERVTVAAPITYSTYRFATSLVSKKGYESF